MSSDDESSIISPLPDGKEVSFMGRRGIEEQKILKNGKVVRLEQDWQYNRGGGWHQHDSTFQPRAPWTSIKSSEWPPKPDGTGKVIELGPLVSSLDAGLAYKVWKLADDTLGKAWKNLSSQSSTPLIKKANLASNVYQHMMMFAVLPLNKEDAKKIFAEQGLQVTWDGTAIVESAKDDIIAASPLRGVSNWSSQAAKDELKKRKLSVKGKVQELHERLIDDEIQKHCGVMPLSDLSHWGIDRSDKYTLQPATNKAMTPIDMYTFAIHLSPYNPTYWLSRAYCHYQQAYFDLALGDAYRAQIICNTIEQTKDRYSKDGFHTQVQNAIEKHIMAEPEDGDGYWSELVTMMREPQGIQPFISLMQQSLLNIMCLSLQALNCWDDYDSYHRQLATRNGRLYMERYLTDLRRQVSKKAEKVWRKKKEQPGLFWFERHQGAVSAENKYPYERDDIMDLFPNKQDLMDKLTEELFEHKSEEIRPEAPTDTCEVKIAPRDQGFGVFAKTSIKKGELIHFEEPTIRGHLPPRRLKNDRTRTPFVDDIRCENCKVLVDDQERRPSIDEARSVHSNDADEEPYCTCAKHWIRKQGDKRGLIFCPSGTRKKTCVSIAFDLYHYDGCGRNWRWLYDTMRPNVWQWSDMEHFSHNNEVHGTFLSLLLRSVAETTLIRREDYDEPGIAPQEIDELLMLSGNSKSWRQSWFPFTMSANIIVPFDIVSFLGINIFRDLAFDTWQLQIILRKLLVNAVPWDEKRRQSPAVGKKEEYKLLEHPTQQTRRVYNGYTFEDWDPSFLNLYLFPGLSMFNHTCAGMQNAEWAFDTQILNRVIVWAHEDIQAGDEIRIRYQSDAVESKHDAFQLFGRPCKCPNKAQHYDKDEMEIDDEKEDSLSEFSESESSKDEMEIDGGEENMLFVFSEGITDIGSPSAKPSKRQGSPISGNPSKRQHTLDKGSRGNPRITSFAGESSMLRREE